MPEDLARMVDGSRAPTPAGVARWIGARNFARWTDLTAFIGRRYPGVFNVEWLFGGQKYGWSLRLKKSKSFCTLIPERGRLKVLLVFGRDEREKVEAILSTLVSHIRADYESSHTYHDGKWLFATVDSVNALNDVKRLLALKRKPKVAGVGERLAAGGGKGRRRPAK